MDFDYYLDYADNFLEFKPQKVYHEGLHVGEREEKEAIELGYLKYRIQDDPSIGILVLGQEEEQQEYERYLNYERYEY